MEKCCPNIGCANIGDVFLLHPEVKHVILMCNRCWKHKIKIEKDLIERSNVVPFNIYFGWHTEYTEISKEEAEVHLILSE